MRKRFGAALPEDNPVAFHGEAGYQADLLMPGLRFKFVLVYAVTKHPWVQVPAGQIGIVVAQIGQPLPIGATSTTLVNIATVLAEKGIQFVPQILVAGGGNALDGLAATLTKALAGQNLLAKPGAPDRPPTTSSRVAGLCRKQGSTGILAVP